MPAFVNSAEITEKTIGDWKKKHGDLFEIKVGEKKLILKRPDRKVLGLASSEGAADPFKFNELIMENCALGGDREMIDNDNYFLAACKHLDKVIEFEEAEIKKL